MIKFMHTAHDARLPLYQQLHDDIVAKITNKEWRLDQPIAPEQELAKTYGTAVGTVRKAVELLVAEGILERFQGRGTFIRRASFDGSLFRFFRFQTKSGERKIPASRILARDVVEPPEPVIKALQLDVSAKAIRMSRLRLIDAAPMLIEEIWLPQQKFAAFMSVEIDRIGDLLYPEYEQHCNQVIAYANETLTVEAVNRTQARQLHIEPGSPVVVIERLAFSYDNHPLEWRRSRGPADQFQYHVTIR